MEEKTENQKIEEKIKPNYKKAVLIITFPCAVLLYILCSFVAWDINFSEWHWVVRLIFVVGVIFCFGFLTIMRWQVESEKNAENNLKKYLSNQTKSKFQQRLEELAKERTEKKESENGNNS